MSNNWDLATRVNRVCKHCGADFSTLRSRQVYCRRECAYQDALRRDRERTPESREAAKRRARARALARRTWVVRRPNKLPIHFGVNLPADLAAWVQGVKKDRGCSASEILRGAIEYAQTGRTDLRPLRLHQAPPARVILTHLTVTQGLYLDEQREG